MISSYINPKIIMELHKLYSKIYTKDHIILSFKAFARFPMFIQKESKELEEMIKMLNNFIDEMNANDILDIMYWARKFNSSGLK